MVFDMHVNSLRNANIRSLWEDDVHPHYVMRRYAEFTASLIQLNVDYGDGQVSRTKISLFIIANGFTVRPAMSFLYVKLVKLLQLELNLDRLRMSIDDMLVKLANLFQKPKLHTVFLINNYDMTIVVLKVHSGWGILEILSDLFELHVWQKYKYIMLLPLE